MTNSTGDVEALKRMQRDAAKLRAERKRRRSIQTLEAEKQSEIKGNQKDTEEQAEQDSAGEASPPESEQTARHYADQLAAAVKQLEDMVRKQPALVLVAAFTTGIAVGNLFSRR